MNNNRLVRSILPAIALALWEVAVGFAQGGLAGGEVVCEDARIALRFDARLHAVASLKASRGAASTVSEDSASRRATPPQFVKINGQIVRDFRMEPGNRPTPTAINTVHGIGRRLRICGVARLSNGIPIRKSVVVELYEKYPGTALFRTSYENLGAASVTVNTVYETMWRLPSASLWALHPRNWRWGEDFLFPIGSGVRLTGANLIYPPGTPGPASLGGGLPAVSYMGPEMSVTLGYLAPTMKIVRFPLVEEAGTVAVGIERDIGMGAEPSRLEPGQVFESLPTFLCVHGGDFYDGMRTMSRLYQDRGVWLRDPPVEDVTAPGWCNRGDGDNWSKRSMLEMLPTLKAWGVKWVHFGGGWENNLGDYEPSAKFDGRADLASFIARLHREGFRTTAFMSDLQVDPASRIAREHPEYFVADSAGKPLTSTGLYADKSFWMLCPAYEPARAFVKQVCVKLATEYGFDGVKNDGNVVPRPCFHPRHRHAYPEQSVEEFGRLNQAVFETFAELKPRSFVSAFCFDGVMPYYWHLPFTSRPWPNADQHSERQSRLKQKLYKAILGPRRVLLDDLSDAKHLTGLRGAWQLGAVSGLAMGSVLETAVTPSYDYSRHRYDDIFRAFHREMLPDGGEYLNLYDIVRHKPEAHAVRKEGRLYYGFFAGHFEGDLELRGLESDATYSVTDYLRDRGYGMVKARNAVAVLKRIRFDDCLLLKLEPTDRGTAVFEPERLENRRHHTAMERNITTSASGLRGAPCASDAAPAHPR